MLDALVDTLMALWNATWRERVLPTLFAFLAISLSAVIFLMQVGLPTFSRLSSVSGHGSVHVQSGKSVSLAINPRVTGSVQAVVVPTPVRVSGDTKKTLPPTPAPTQNTDSPPAQIYDPMPVQMPGIISQAGIDGSAYTGTTDRASVSPAKRETHASVRHSRPPRPTVPSVVVTPAVPTATATASIVPSSVPTMVATPAIPPTSISGGTPIVVVPTIAPTPAYPASPISESTPVNTATVSPSLVPTNTGSGG